MRIAVGMEMKRIGSGRNKNKRADTSAEVGEDIAKRARKQEAEEEDGQGRQDDTPSKGPIGFQDEVKASGRGLATLGVTVW